MNKLILIIVIAVLLVGCGPANDGTQPDGPLGGTRHFTSEEGVDCIFVKLGYGGGLSCNWEKFNKENGL